MSITEVDGHKHRSGFRQNTMSMLPESSGLLPYWLLVVVAFSVLNTVQCYKSAHFARRTFSGPTAAAEVTPFAGRLFGSWSFLSALVRLYAAYHINDRHLYFLALSTYCIVLTHFAGELLVYGTLKVGKGLAPPLFVATTSVVWMITQWSFYAD